MPNRHHNHTHNNKTTHTKTERGVYRKPVLRARTTKYPEHEEEYLFNTDSFLIRFCPMGNLFGMYMYGRLKHDPFLLFRFILSVICGVVIIIAGGIMYAKAATYVGWCCYESNDWDHYTRGRCDQSDEAPDGECEKTFHHIWISFAVTGIAFATNLVIWVYDFIVAIIDYERQKTERREMMGKA